MPKHGALTSIDATPCPYRAIVGSGPDPRAVRADVRVPDHTFVSQYDGRLVNALGFAQHMSRTVVGPRHDQPLVRREAGAQNRVGVAVRTMSLPLVVFHSCTARSVDHVSNRAPLFDSCVPRTFLMGEASELFAGRGIQMIARLSDCVTMRCSSAESSATVTPPDAPGCSTIQARPVPVSHTRADLSSDQGEDAGIAREQDRASNIASVLECRRWSTVGRAPDPHIAVE